jgi:hypothetical protein
VVKGICLLCEKLVFSYEKERTPKVHRKCLVDYQREHHAKKLAVISKPFRPGGQVTTENLAKHFSWAVRHHLGGESFAAIGDDVGRHPTTVEENIDRIMGYLPDPQLVASAFRRRLSLLLLNAENPFVQPQNSA